MLRALVELCGGREVLNEARVRLGAPRPACWPRWTTCWRSRTGWRRATRNCRCTSTSVSCAVTTTTGVVFAVFVPGEAVHCPGRAL